MHPLEPAEFAALQAVADEIRDSLEEDGHCVTAAIEHHPSFDESNHPASALLRNMVKSAAARGASRAGGFGQETVSGGLDLIWLRGAVYRKYRLKRASVTGEGTYDFVVGDGSTLLQVDGDSLWREERWVLGYTTSAAFQIDQIFVAEVVGVSETRVKKLLLGDVVPLATGLTPRGPGFVSDDEDTLPGFDDGVDEPDEETGDGYGAA